MEYLANNPVAAVLLSIIALLLAAIIFLLVERPKPVTISDEAPASGRPRDAWMKLQNEGARYIKIKDGRVYLRIVR